MKKTVLVLSVVLLVFITKNDFAQSKKSFRMGLKASPTLAWFKPDVNLKESTTKNFVAESDNNYSSEGLTFGFSYGFMAEFALSDNYALATGFDIAYCGGKLKYPSSQSINDTNLTAYGVLHRKYGCKYIEIPLALKMKTKEIGYITYFGEFGIGTGFNLNAKANDEFIITGVAGSITNDGKDVKEDVSFFRESLILSLGIEYSLGGSTSLILGATFNNGFTDILTGKNAIDTSIKEKAISNYLEINVGVIF